MKVSSLLVALSSLTLAGAACADDNLIANGDFSAGNTDFASSYAFRDALTYCGMQNGSSAMPCENRFGENGMGRTNAEEFC